MFFPRKKFIIAAALIGFFLLVVAGRLFYLQVLHGKEYSRFSEAYTVKEIPIPAPRGILYDRKGRVLATTRPAFNLLLSLHKVKDMERLLEDLSPLLGFSPEELRLKIRTSSRDLPRFRPLLLAADLNRDQVAKIQMAQSLASSDPKSGGDWGALETRVEPLRRYEEAESLGHLFGYLREISEEKLKEMEKSAPGVYSAGDWVGAQGLERRFDRDLRGREGRREVIVDALGHEMSLTSLGLNEELNFSPPRAGDNLYLTIDREL